MSRALVSVERYILVRKSGREIRIRTTGCGWCTEEAICSVCSAKADEARAYLDRGARLP